MYPTTTTWQRGPQRWQRSSFCNTGACVEVAEVGGVVGMRDSKNPDQPPLLFSRADWNTFVDRIADTVSNSS